MVANLYVIDVYALFSHMFVLFVRCLVACFWLLQYEYTSSTQKWSIWTVYHKWECHNRADPVIDAFVPFLGLHVVQSVLFCFICLTASFPVSVKKAQGQVVMVVADASIASVERKAKLAFEAQSDHHDRIVIAINHVASPHNGISSPHLSAIGRFLILWGAHEDPLASPKTRRVRPA